jgi:hypothetical protein
MTGREYRLPNDYILEELEDDMTPNEYAQMITRMLARAHEDVKIKFAFYANKLSNSQLEKMQTEFEEGQEVMLYVPAIKPGLTQKLVRRWVGPFVVNRKFTPKVYELRDKQGRIVQHKVSVLRLKSYHDRATEGAKWLTVEFNERLDWLLIEDGVVQDVIAEAQNLADLNTKFSVDGVEEIIDLYVPEEEIEEMRNEEEMLQLMVNDKETSGSVVIKKGTGMSGAIGHEAYVDDSGVVRLKGRITTEKQREQRLEKIPSKYAEFEVDEDLGVAQRGQKRSASLAKEGGSVAGGEEKKEKKKRGRPRKKARKE